MNANVLLVAIRGAIAGEVTRTRTGLRFEYVEDYRRDPNATPLSVSMPLDVRVHRDATIAPWLRGLLPDDQDVLTRWARHFGVRPITTFDLLAAPIGEDCAGAVQFAPPERMDEVLGRPGRIDWLSEAEVAERLRQLRADRSSWLGPDFTGQWSLAGQQAKTALRFEDGRWGDPRGAAPTTHILKPAIAGLDDHDLNEHLCLSAAHHAELIAARTTVERFEDQGAVVVERFDRSRDARGVVRVHQEDVCQALSVFPDAKYEADGGPSAADVAALVREVMPASAADEAVRRLVDAMAWNWVIGGTDAHAKNSSLLLSGDQVRLSPLYDVASALPYPDVYAPKLQLAMKIGGEYRLGVIERRHWVRFAEECSCDPEVVVDQVRALASRAPEAFLRAGRATDALWVESPLTVRLVDAVAERAQHCLRVLS